MQCCSIVLLSSDRSEATSLPRKALKPGAPCSGACAAAVKALEVCLSPCTFTQKPDVHLTVPRAERACLNLQHVRGYP